MNSITRTAFAEDAPEQQNPATVERLLELAQALDGPDNIPLATRAAFVKRELAMMCKQLMDMGAPTHGAQAPTQTASKSKELAGAAQDDGTPYAQQSLMRWGQALRAEGNSLGDPLVSYASRWARDIALEPSEQAKGIVREYEALALDTKPGSWCDRAVSFLRRFGLSASGS